MNKKHLGFILLSMLCIGIGVGGLAVLWDYANRPGLAANPQKTWPPSSSLQHSSTISTLVMFVHPRCDCTEASISELAEIMTQVDNRLKVIFVFVTPFHASNAWKSTGLWSAAQLIPGAQTILDQGAVEADLFGAQSSGQVLLYAPQGQLIFAGGITAARGQAGENPGKSAIISYINQRQLTTQTAPVFGCVLKDYSEP